MRRFIQYIKNWIDYIAGMGKKSLIIQIFIIVEFQIITHKIMENSFNFFFSKSIVITVSRTADITADRKSVRIILFIIPAPAAVIITNNITAVLHT